MTVRFQGGMRSVENQLDGFLGGTRESPAGEAELMSGAHPAPRTFFS